MAKFKLLLKDNKFVVVLITFIVGFIISWVLNSRSFCLGLFTSGCLLIAKANVLNRLKLLKWGAIILILFFFLFYLKIDSSLGRLLIYKICYRIWWDHWLLGIGVGRFKEVYMYYQANYFASGHYTIKELLLADNTIFAFNDYVELVIENGICGIIIFFFYIYFLAKTIKSIFISTSFFFDIAFLIYFTISIAALFTHIYDRPIILFIFISAFYIVFDFQYRDIYNGYLRLLIASTLVIIFFSTKNINKFIEYKAYRSFDRAVQLVNSGFKREAIDTLKLIYPTLKHDGVYLAYYGSQLLNIHYTNEACDILHQAVQLCPSSDTYINLANSYYNLGQYLKSEESFVTAINMVPNRFGSRYGLYNLYKIRNCTKKALIVGNEILNLPIKIPSSVISSIKLNVKIDLNKVP